MQENELLRGTVSLCLPSCCVLAFLHFFLLHLFFPALLPFIFKCFRDLFLIVYGFITRNSFLFGSYPITHNSQKREELGQLVQQHIRQASRMIVLPCIFVTHMTMMWSSQSISNLIYLLDIQVCTMRFELWPLGSVVTWMYNSVTTQLGNNRFQWTPKLCNTWRSEVAPKSDPKLRFWQRYWSHP